MDEKTIKCNEHMKCKLLAHLPLGNFVTFVFSCAFEFQSNNDNQIKDYLIREFKVQTKYQVDVHGYDLESTNLQQREKTL